MPFETHKTVSLRKRRKWFKTPEDVNLTKYCHKVFNHGYGRCDFSMAFQDVRNFRVYSALVFFFEGFLILGTRILDEVYDDD